MNQAPTKEETLAWYRLQAAFAEKHRATVEAMREELLQTALSQGLPVEDIRAIKLGGPDSVVKAHAAAKHHIEAWRKEKAGQVAQAVAKCAAARAAARVPVDKRRAKNKAASASRRQQRRK